ncbi:hypothetical protein ACIUWV_26680 [Pseudomonas aeruginosa]
MSKPKLQCYGWDAVRLSGCSIEHLQQLREFVELEHKNPLDAEGHPLEGGLPTIHIFNKAGRKKLEAISWAFRYKRDEVKAFDAIAKATGGDV